jgi:hypothetical protein
MFSYITVSKDEFFDIVRSIEYRDDDIKEALEFGCSSIENCYRKALHAFNKYYIVYEGNNPVCTIQLARNGNITFFIAKNIKSPIHLVRKLRELATNVVYHCGPIVTKTASWYNEALRLNKLVGFKTLKLYNGYGLYVLGMNGCIDGWQD